MRWLPVLLLFLTNFSFAGIPVLALSEDGREIVGEIEEHHYSETLIALKEGVDQKIAGELMSVSAPERGWRLSTFTVGLGLTGEIGVGPFKYSGVLKQRFLYSR